MSFVVILVVAALPLRAGTYEVGPHGDFHTIGEALVVALADGGSDSIKVEVGEYRENLSITVGVGTLSISGGWDATFTTPTADPSATVIDGGFVRVVDVNLEDTELFSLSNLTIQNGRANETGGGVRIVAVAPTVNAELFINNVWFVGNTVDSDAAAGEGGGLYLDLSSIYAEVNNNRFIDNSARVPSPPPASTYVAGGALFADISTSSYLEFSGNTVSGSACSNAEITGIAFGCGVYVQMSGASSTSFNRNTVVDSSVTGFSFVQGIAGWFHILSNQTSVLERNRWQGGTVTGTPSVAGLLRLETENVGLLTQRSSLIADGPAAGLVVVNDSSATWHGVNLTVAGHDGHGIYLYDAGGSADHTLYNSISYGNGGADLGLSGSTDVVEGNNLIGIDPTFVNPIAGRYEIQEGSIAVDGGNATPPGGLSTRDLAGNPRTQGAAVDIGAYEGTDLIWADGFESGNTSAW